MSLLIMPDDRDSELYFWYNGNPFDLETKQSAIVAFDSQVYHTEPIEEKTKELFGSIYAVSAAVGYLIAKKDFMVVSVPTSQWNRVSREVLQFFPGDKSAVHRVTDKKKKIAKINDLPKRMNSVRAVEGQFATKNLAEVSLRIPHTRVPEKEGNPQAETMVA